MLRNSSATDYVSKNTFSQKKESQQNEYHTTKSIMHIVYDTFATFITFYLNCHLLIRESLAWFYHLIPGTCAFSQR